MTLNAGDEDWLWGKATWTIKNSGKSPAFNAVVNISFRDAMDDPNFQLEQSLLAEDEGGGYAVAPDGEWTGERTVLLKKRRTPRDDWMPVLHLGVRYKGESIETFGLTVQRAMIFQRQELDSGTPMSLREADLILTPQDVPLILSLPN